jgi:peptide/nickel transport system permease protein
MVRLTRSSMMEVLDSEYIKFARVKGTREHLIIWKHALRNAIIPVMTFAGISLGGLLNGSIVVEIVFAWPGLGRLMLTSVTQRDYAVLEATVLTAGAMYILMAMIVDILYAYVDPRMREE